MHMNPVELSDGITYSVFDEGTGPAVLLLHGFPDTATMWHRQMAALLQAGFRVIAPDLRGRGGSSKPQQVEDYNLLQIVGDLSRLLRCLGVPRAHVVGHDWGAATAWLFAALMRAKVDHLAVMSVGHPSAFRAPTVEQRQRSWYMLLYQFAGVAEELLRRRNWELFREMIGGEGDVEHYIEVLSQPGALTAGLNWYRANNHPSAEFAGPPRLPAIVAPTLAMWGARDGAMTEEQMVLSAAFVQGPWIYECFEQSGHWIPLDEPERLNQRLLSFLGSTPTVEPALTRAKRRF